MLRRFQRSRIARTANPMGSGVVAPARSARSGSGARSGKLWVFYSPRPGTVGCSGLCDDLTATWSPFREGIPALADRGP